ncbi:hypothetical protein Tco_1292708 [Tanacetum coccineum]
MAFMLLKSYSLVPKNTIDHTNDVNTGSFNVNTPSSSVSTASISNNTVYVFMVENPNGSNLLHQDLEQIHEDDLEEMDLKWQLSLLRHFARECRAPRSKEGQFRNQDNTRKQGNNEDTSSKAMLAIDGVYTDKTCSKNCLKNYETLKKQCDYLIVKLNESEFKATTYKRGLATLEDQIITYKKNEVLFSEEIGVLKRDVACKDYELASKDLNQLLESQITDKSKKGVGFNAVPPPYPLIYNRPNKLDLSYSGLDEFKEPKCNGYGPRDIVLKSTIECDNELENSKENTDDSLVKEQVSEEENSSVESPLNVVKETNNCHDHQRKKMVTGNNYNRVDHDYYAKSSHPNTHRNMTPIAVLLKSGLTPLSTARPGKPQMNDKGFVDSGCSRHMTGNMYYLSNFKEFDGGYVTFGGGAYGGRITSKGTLKTDNLDFDDVYFVNEIKFNLFSVSQMCDKKNYVLFTDTECLVLSPNFKLLDKSQILLKIPRKDSMYSFDIKNIVPKESLTCLVEKATSDESMLWHRRLGDAYYVNMQSNKNEWKDMLHQTKVFKYIAKSKEVGTLRYLSLVVPLKKVGDEAVYKELGDRMERAAMDCFLPLKRA